MKKDITESITNDESKRFIELEKTIKAGRQTFLDVGRALQEIRDGRLYRSDHATFEDYCQSKWDFSRQYAHSLISSAAAVSGLPKHLSTVVDKERPARALAKVPEAKRAAVVERAAAAGPLTAKAIADAAKETEPVIELDNEGRAIPAKILPLWRRADDESREGMNMISKIKSAIKSAQESEDPAWVELNHSSCLASLENVWGDLKRVKPHAVCHACGGNRPEKCMACKGRGFVSSFFWKMCVPEEFKNLKK